MKPSDISFFVDFSNISTLFQDSAGKEPVTDVGQRVASVRCEAGLFQLYKHPILQRDEAGRNFVEFDK